MSRAKKDKDKPPPPSPAGADQTLTKYRAPQYRARAVPPPLGAPPVVPMIGPPVVRAAAAPAPSPATSASSPRVEPASPPAPPAAPSAAPPPATALEPASARPRQWGAPIDAPPEGLGSAAHASNAYDEQLRERELRDWYRAKPGEVPQGETELVHAWVHALTRLPPQAMTVWLVRTDPLPSYSFSLDGMQLAGDWPDRRLYDAVTRKRRQPTVPETFQGRIRGRLPTGAFVEIGCGEIALPPEPAQTTATPWIGSAGPVWPAIPGYPPGYPPPYGALPPGYAPPYGLPPYGAPPGYPAPYGYGYGAGPAPGAAAQQSAMEKVLVELATSGRGSPETMVQLLKVMQDGNRERSSEVANLQTMLLKAVLEQRSEPRSGGNALEELRTMAALVNELRGPQTESRGGIQIHKVDGSSIVEDGNGNLDVGASVGLTAMPLLRDVLAKRMAPPPPKPAGPPVGGGGPAVAKAPPPPPSALNGTNGRTN